MGSYFPKAPALLRFWIVLAAFCTVAGWTLSLFGLLTPLGYVVAFAVGVFSWVISRNVSGQVHAITGVKPAGKYLRRFSRAFPLAFLILAVLAIIGGFLYPPSNPDGLTHRVPRLLNWLAAGQWHWIENAPVSFNTRATGFEWMMSPLVVLLKTDRWIFLLNVVGIVLLPGLVFSVLQRLGIRNKAAWHWMWIVPTGYCLILQVGSIANDLYGAALALAALDFALRARESGRITDAWFAIISAALLSNAKASNLPLLLPCAVAMMPSLRLLWRRTLPTAVVCLLAVGVSLVPVAWFNIRHLGDWSGAAVEAPLFSKLTPATAFIGNALNLTAQNLTPPLFPAAGWWNEHVYRALPTSLVQSLENSFEPGGAHIQLMEMQLEVAAGLGFGVCVLLIVTCVAARFRKPGVPSSPSGDDLLLRLIRWSAWISLLVYMVKTGLSTSARLITPYYALLLPSLLIGPGPALLTRRSWWRAMAYTVFGLAGLLVVLNPGRPLWPANAVLSRLAAAKPDSSLLKKAVLLYESYAQRWDALAPVRQHLPADSKNVGLISFISASSIETSLWRPFGERRIWWLTPNNPLEELRRKHIRYVVIGTDGPSATKSGIVFKPWFEDWLRTRGGRIIAEVNIRLVATGQPIPWYVVEVSRADEQ